MHPEVTLSPAASDMRWASADILRITLGQLRAWEAQASRHLVTVPKADDEAWEDTEIDARRTML